MKEFLIDNFLINDGSNVFIIAELSANHNGSIDLAIDTIKAAKRAGADAIKLQTYTPDTITLNVKAPDFLIKKDSIWGDQYLYDLYKQAYTPWEWHDELFRVAKEEGLICFSSPFDLTSVDFLESLNTPAYKIASFEITDIPLIEYIAKKNKPIIISTGIATKEDIELAIATCKKVNNDKIILLKCTSSYPAPIEEADLIMISQMKKDFNCYTGLSDHTMGFLAPVIATSLGAKIIEKHFILDRNLGGPDSKFSMNEIEFKEMVDMLRLTDKSLGVNSYQLRESQISSRDYCRSLYFSKDLKTGDVITLENVKSIRPGYGLHPKYLNSILGKSVNTEIKKGDRVDLKVINV